MNFSRMLIGCFLLWELMPFPVLDSMLVHCPSNRFPIKEVLAMRQCLVWERLLECIRYGSYAVLNINRSRSIGGVHI